MLKTVLVDTTTGQALATSKGSCSDTVLITENCSMINSRWNYVANLGAVTGIGADCRPMEAIMLTGIIVSSKIKVVGGTITLQFSDGTNTEICLVMETEEKTFEWTYAFLHGLKGWKGADFQVVTSAAGHDVSTLVTYVRLTGDLVKKHDEWKAEK